MNAETVAPFQLHRELERAKDLGEEERRNILASILASKNLAVIRRIPELLSPLTNEEKAMIVEWAEGAVQDEETSNRDFAFHLMVNCEVSVEQILSVLEQHKTFSRNALEHIQELLEGSGPVEKLDEYLREAAETLIKGEQISPRDRGRHMLMTLARTSDDWQALTKRFSQTEITDLRQKVLERFLEECRNDVALTLFVDNVVNMCMTGIRAAEKVDVHQEASHMHWVLTCLGRLERKTELAQAALLFRTKFGSSLPRSVQWRVEPLLSRTPVQTAKEEPSYIEQAIRDGWKVRSATGRQVILEKDGKTVTRYRS